MAEKQGKQKRRSGAEGIKEVMQQNIHMLVCTHKGHHPETGNGYTVRREKKPGAQKQGGSSKAQGPLAHFFHAGYWMLLGF